MATSSIRPKRKSPIIRWATVLLVFATPFASSPAVFDQLRLVKEITVQCLAVIIIAAWIIHKLLQPSGHASPWKPDLLAWLPLAIGLLLGWSLLGLFFSERASLGWDPFVNLLLYAGICAVLMDQADSEFLKAVLYAALAAGAVNALYAVAQYYGHDPIFRVDFAGTKAEGRYGAAGFLDNPNVAGAYFSVVFVAGIELILLEPPGWKMLFIVGSLAALLSGIFYTQTLAAIAGWIAGLSVWTGALFIYEKSMRKYLVGPLIGMALMTGLVVLVNKGFRERVQAVKTLIQAKDWDNLLSRRYTIWTATVQMIKDKPIIGHGLGSHAALFFDYRRAAVKKGIGAESFTTIAVEAHNEYLQIWAEMGLIGLLLCLAVVALYARAQIQTMTRPALRAPTPSERGTPLKNTAATGNEIKAYRVMAIGSLAILANVLVNSLANFPFHLAAMASIVIILLALNVRPTRNESAQGAPSAADAKVFRRAAAVVTVILAFWVITYLCRPYTASKLVLRSLLVLQQIQEKGSGREEALRQTLAGLEEAKRLSPTNHDIYMLRGGAFVMQKRYEQALAEYYTSAMYRPTMEVYDALGRVYLALKDPDKARENYQKLLEFDPKSEGARAGLAEAETLRKKKATP